MKKIGKLLFLSFLCFMIVGLTACDSNKLYIGENGNWFVNGEDLGVSAQGEKGEKGDAGEQGESIKGDQGETGVSITKIEKTGSKDRVDTYTITFSNGNTTTFTVTNGEDGEKGEEGDDLTIKSVTKTKTVGLVDTYTITFSNNTTTTFTITNGEDGKIVTVSSIKKTKTEGLVDTYTITYTDGKTLSFTVTNGKAGSTPYIGENGNWWIDGEDTGYFAGYLVDDADLTPESSGLVFTNAVLNGKAGLVVTEWDGDAIDTEIADAIENGTRECNIVIPNYVGATPVIGIASDVFENCTFINSITLSKNTVYLGEDAFKNCSKLSSVDFNGCKLTAIPNYCFYGTSITDIELPKTVTKLGSYSFGTIYLDDFDYSNITYFGDHCLQHLLTPYVYLSEDVTYVGSYAFASTYVFTEYNTIPSTWGSYIAGDDKACYSTVTTGCINSTDYIYSLYNGGISLHAYKGNEKWLEIPSQIDGYTVKQIGYGFDSITENYVDYWINTYENSGLYNCEEEALYKFKKMEGIIIPSTVTSIEYGALLNYGTFIYVPESVNTMWAYTGWFITDDDLIGSLIAFESTSLPTLKESWIATSNSPSDVSYFSRIVAIGIDYNKVYYDEESQMVFYKETLGYSLLACLDFESEMITIPSTYNEQNVYTIRKDAFKYNFKVKEIIIESGITKIQGYAFFALPNLEFIYIPSSVSIINAYGFYSVSSQIKFYVGASSKPSEWDSYWAGSNSNNYSITYGVSDNFEVYKDYIYQINNDNTIKLVSYIGEYSDNITIAIPSKIDGKTVKSIGANFYYQTSTYSNVRVYIPSSIIKIDAYAFKFNCSNSYSGYYPTFYIGYTQATIPSTWDSCWCYNSYYSSTGNCNINYYSSLYISDDFAYTVVYGYVALLAYIGEYGSNKIIKIPRKVDGKTVTTISSYFYKSTKKYQDVSFYIPSTVTNIDNNAFYYYTSGSSNYYPKFYIEASSVPSTWDSYWSYDYNYGTGYCYKYYSQKLDY